MESKTCKQCGAAFAIEPDDFSFYEKIGVPPPTFCPECRFQRRLLWRNERVFYRRKCDLCKRDIISVYTADVRFPVYCQKCWWSDAWDPTSYGRDFDFTRPFFEQYKEFADTVPALSIMNDDGIGSVNSEYTYDWAFSKNIYLGVCGWYVENGLYLYAVGRSKDMMDDWSVYGSQLVYESVNSNNCYNSRFLNSCFDSNDCTFGYDLKGCSDCLMCVGLRNKRYCILNKEYDKEGYEKEIVRYNLGSRSGLEKLKKEFDGFVLKFPRKYSYMLKSVNSTGFMLMEAKMSKDCFYGFGPIENSRFLVQTDGAKDTYDCNNTGHPELCYEGVTPDNSRGNKFSIFCWKCTEAEYSNNCHSCVSVFGSTGLKHVSYAIFNKVYPKEQFIALREKIVAHMKNTGEWGEFFPRSISPFAYNETPALEWLPLKKEEALRKGFRWKDDEKKNYTITKQPKDVPDTISVTTDAILNDVVGCAHEGACNEKCTTAFKIVPAELQLYRKLGMPLPVLCPNCRHYTRIAKCNPTHLWKRRCTCAGGASSDNVFKNTREHFHGTSPCPNQFQTSYAPDRPDIVYCEECYNAEIA